MELKPLTKKQQRFAQDNHDLVYAFLNSKNLPEDTFYDIVIFGYLRAVQKYCEDKSLHKYKFSTLAWKHMRGSLSNYYKYLSSPKRNAPAVSLDEPVGSEEGLRFDEIISHASDYMSELQEELLMHEMAKKLPPRAMRIVRMKVQGTKMHDIMGLMIYCDILQLFKSAISRIAFALRSEHLQTMWRIIGAL